MEANHKSLLRKNRVVLARELCLDEVCQIMVGDEIMTDQMVEVINSKASSFDRNVAFLIKLPTRGPLAFDVFCQALHDTEQSHLADLLSPSRNSTKLNGFLELKQCNTCNKTPPEFQPSLFTFPQSTPLKLTSEPPDLNSEMSSINIASPETYISMTNSLNGSVLIKKSPDAISGFRDITNIDRRSDPKRHVPVEHMDANILDSQFENLRSNTSIDVLRSTAGFDIHNHTTSTAIGENHSLLRSSNHINSSAIQCNMQSGSIVSDAPTWENVAVQPTTVKFLQERMHDCYPMFNSCKGVVLIINVTEFEESACLDDRLGGERDFARLELMFKQLSYHVFNLKNGTGRQIWNTLENFSVWPRLAEYSSCFVVLMSHGEDGVIFGKDGQPVHLKNVFDLFANDKCSYLQNKPKVFLTQACRGDQPDKGTDQIDGPTPEKVPRLSEGDQGKKVKRRLLDDNKNQINVKLPTTSDCLFAYATVPGYTAMRNTEQGSWFIQAFIQIVAFHARDKSLLEIMTMTNNQMKAKEGYSPATEFHRCKEMSEFTSCLCKPFYFFPGLHLEQIP